MTVESKEYMLIATYDDFDIVILQEDLDKNLWLPRVWYKHE